ncbi:hypothetical protein AVEN_219775-1 [Araneus ventricosus]|uniref:Uncharacterized protein n=1 Tax=Araneus ventricosus TaxID=182803 RepID=A0A4Y2PIA5_ARAVE|nr:hypothetical protein AVEN_219775-1 [Araneus ventricosus]
MWAIPMEKTPLVPKGLDFVFRDSHFDSLRYATKPKQNDPYYVAHAQTPHKERRSVIGVRTTYQSQCSKGSENLLTNVPTSHPERRCALKGIRIW